MSGALPKAGPGVRAFSGEKAAARAAVRAFAAAMRRRSGTFTVLLSGGPGISAFLEELAGFKSADWGSCRFYFSSERTDGAGRMASYRRARELFFSPAGVPDSSVINFPPLRPRAAAALYSGSLAAAVREGGFGLAVLDASEPLPAGGTKAVPVPGGAAVTLGTLTDCDEALFFLPLRAGGKKRTGRQAGHSARDLFAKAGPRLKKRLFVF